MVRCQTPLEMKAVPAAFRAVTNQDRGETVWESCPQHVSGYAAVSVRCGEKARFADDDQGSHPPRSCWKRGAVLGKFPPN